MYYIEFGLAFTPHQRAFKANSASRFHFHWKRRRGNSPKDWIIARFVNCVFFMQILPAAIFAFLESEDEVTYTHGHSQINPRGKSHWRHRKTKLPWKPGTLWIWQAFQCLEKVRYMVVLVTSHHACSGTERRYWPTEHPGQSEAGNGGGSAGSERRPPGGRKR